MWLRDCGINGALAMQGGSGRAAYHSEPFSTELDTPQLLALRPGTPGEPLASPATAWKLSLPHGRCLHTSILTPNVETGSVKTQLPIWHFMLYGAAQISPLCPAGDQSFPLVSVQVQLDSKLDSMPVEADSGPCETCTVVISPGVYLSNLSSSDLHAAHASPDVPADPVCVPRGQSQPLPWTWQKNQDLGPLIALGLSHTDCAQAAASLCGSTGVKGSAATASAAAATLQPHGRNAATAKQGAAQPRERAAAPSLAESFVSFLESQAGMKSLTAAESQRPPRPPASAGIVDIKQHQGKRTPIILQASNGKVH